MSDNKKFTQEELDKITKLREENQTKIAQFGTIEVEILLAKQRLDALQDAKAAAEEEYVALQNSERDLVKELNNKYGAGTVDLESGEFIPAN